MKIQWKKRVSLFFAQTHIAHLKSIGQSSCCLASLWHSHYVINKDCLKIGYREIFMHNHHYPHENDFRLPFQTSPTMEKWYSDSPGVQFGLLRWQWQWSSRCWSQDRTVLCSHHSARAGSSGLGPKFPWRVLRSMAVIMGTSMVDVPLPLWAIGFLHNGKIPPFFNR